MVRPHTANSKIDFDGRVAHSRDRIARTNWPEEDVAFALTDPAF